MRTTIMLQSEDFADYRVVGLREGQATPFIYWRGGDMLLSSEGRAQLFALRAIAARLSAQADELETAVLEHESAQAQDDTVTT